LCAITSVPERIFLCVIERGECIIAAHSPTVFLWQNMQFELLHFVTLQPPSYYKV
jgi:hypothetical protein